MITSSLTFWSGRYITQNPGTAFGTSARAVAMDSYLNASAPATIKLLLESLQPKRTFSPLWRLVEEGPIMPIRAPFEKLGGMRTFAEHGVEQAKFAFDKFMDATQSTMSTF